MPIPEQTSTTAGRGGSCSNAVPATAPGRGTVGYPYFFSTLTDEGPFAAQYGHTVFPSLDASRISPFLFFSAAPSLSRTLECSWYLSCKHATSYARRGFQQGSSELRRFLFLLPGCEHLFLSHPQTRPLQLMSWCCVAPASALPEAERHRAEASSICSRRGFQLFPNPSLLRIMPKGPSNPLPYLLRLHSWERDGKVL